MSRNSSGVYSLPSGNPVVTDTVIESAWANNTMEDIGDTLSDSLDRTGKGGMLAPLLLADGTVSLPAYAFVSDETSGIYKADTADYRFSIQGSDLLRYRPGIVSVKSIIGDATAGPDFVVHRNSPTPAAADLLGRVKLDGENSADEQVTYAQISASLVDPTDASEDGSLTFWTMQDGTLTEVMFLDNNGDVSVTGGDFSVTGDTTLTGAVTINGDVLTTEITYLDGATSNIQDQIDNIVAGEIRPTIINDATTARTLSASDEISVIVFSNAAAIAVTVPDNATTPLPNGFICHLYQQGAGQITVAGAGGVTVNSSLTLKTRVQYSSLSLVKIATDEWYLVGDMALS